MFIKKSLEAGTMSCTTEPENETLVSTSSTTMPQSSVDTPVNSRAELNAETETCDDKSSYKSSEAHKRSVETNDTCSDERESGMSKPEQNSQSNSADGIYQCPECSEKFKVKTDWRRHVNRHKFICPHCDKNFGRHKDLEVHIRRHLGEKPFQCEECGKTFVANKDLKDHRRTHRDEHQFVCKYCNGFFKYRTSYHNHLRKHTGDMFTCDRCEKRFVSKVQLESHYRIHTGEKPYKCTECEKTFTHGSGLKSHMKFIHSENKNEFACEICGKGFVTHGNYLVHCRVHSEERPFVCHLCGSKFKSKLQLRRHLMTHDGNKPYRCQFCEKAFDRKNRMREHQKRYHDEFIDVFFPVDSKDNARTQNKHTEQLKVAVDGRRVKAVALSSNAEIGKTETYHPRKTKKGQRIEHDDVCGSNLKVEREVEAKAVGAVKRKDKKLKNNKNDLASSLALVGGKDGYEFNDLEKGIIEGRPGIEEDVVTSDERFTNVSIPFNTVNPPINTKSDIETKNKESEESHQLGDTNDADASSDSDERETVDADDSTEKPQSTSVDKTYQCPKCSEIFKLKPEWKKHVNRHKFECPLCGKSFSRKRDLDVHLRRHLGEKPFRCEECDSKFVIKKDLTAHKRIHTNKFKCPHCEKTFSRQGHMDVHVRRHLGEKPFQCEECGKTFVSSKELSVHKRSHKDEFHFACKNCDQTFKYRTSYHNHLRKHTGDMFSCDRCEKQFVSKVQLESHYRIHTGEKPYKCNDCEKTFTHGSGLKSHMKFMHTKDKFKFACDLCSKGFVTHGNYVVHRRVHSEERPFVCDLCGNKFKSKLQLRRHVLTHEGYKPFICQCCGKSFDRKNRLADHQKRYHDEIVKAMEFDTVKQPQNVPVVKLKGVVDGRKLKKVSLVTL